MDLNGSTGSESLSERTCHFEPPEHVPRTLARAQTCARGPAELPACHGAEGTRKDPRPEEKKMPKCQKTHLYIVIQDFPSEEGTLRLVRKRPLCNTYYEKKLSRAGKNTFKPNCARRKVLVVYIHIYNTWWYLGVEEGDARANAYYRLWVYSGYIYARSEESVLSSQTMYLCMNTTTLF